MIKRGVQKVNPTVVILTNGKKVEIPFVGKKFHLTIDGGRAKVEGKTYDIFACPTLDKVGEGMQQ
jgi:hypothetical protein